MARPEKKEEEPVQGETKKTAKRKMDIKEKVSLKRAAVNDGTKKVEADETHKSK